MILTSRLLGMSAGTVATPPPLYSGTPADTDWFFAPHMYGNPFQDILGGRLAERGIAAQGFRQLNHARALLDLPKREHQVLHLHWLNVVLAGADSETAERRRMAQFRELLERVKDHGAQIAWTVHNVLPHEGYSEESALEVRRLIIEAADLIHVMAPDTAAKCEGKFHLPEEKTVRVEHPGYHGFYPEMPAALDLRAKWGLPADGKLAVILGGIKPYKGLNEFTAEFEAATAARPRELALLIAGKSSEPLLGTELWARAELSANLHVLPETVADSQVSELMTMADFVVIPYQASLNSGAMVLALTYGKPVLARASAGSTHLLAAGAGFVYQHESELDSVLRDLDWLPAASAAAAEMSRRLDRQRMTGVFAAMARAFVDGGVAAARAAVGPDGGLTGGQDG